MALLVVAEDDADIRAVMRRVFRRDGHTVIEAENGAVALEEVMAQPTVDAVVTDLDMPVMSGSDLCKAIRTSQSSANLPVIIVSGSLLPGEQVTDDAEATAFLRKPFQPAELQACLREALTAGHKPGQKPTVCR